MGVKRGKYLRDLAARRGNASVQTAARGPDALLAGCLGDSQDLVCTTGLDVGDEAEELVGGAVEAHDHSVHVVALCDFLSRFDAALQSAREDRAGGLATVYGVLVADRDLTLAFWDLRTDITDVREGMRAYLRASSSVLDAFD